MNKKFFSIFVFLFPLLHLHGVNKSPSTVITSDQMEMIKRANCNEFHFTGQVQIKSKSFYGECEELWAYTAPFVPQVTHNPWAYLNKSCAPYLVSYKLRYWSYLSHQALPASSSHDQLAPNIGQINKIIALRNVLLETNDVDTGEIKRAKSNKAVIYPHEGKMVLTKNPVVFSSKQGKFMGEKITFFKSSERVIVENKRTEERSTAILSEEGFNL